MKSRMTLSVAGAVLLLAAPGLAARGDRSDSRSDSRQESPSDSRSDSRRETRADTPSFRLAPAPETRREVPAVSPRFEPTLRNPSPDRSTPVSIAPSPGFVNPLQSRVQQPQTDRPVNMAPVQPSRGPVGGLRSEPVAPFGGSALEGDSSRSRNRNRDVGDGMAATRPGGGSIGTAFGRGSDGSGVGASRPGGGSARLGTPQAPAASSVPAFRPGGGSADQGRSRASNGPASPITWRPPSRTPANLRPDPRGGASSGSGGMPGFKGTEAAIPIAFTPSHRPPVITRNRWMEMFHRQPIQFHHVPLGWERPRYHYSGHRWRDHSWYFPYYYDGPWMTGFYYSPFALYTGWFPTYIYPERIVYVEHRVYLRDISSDDDDYDYYSSQTSSLRDTMADIKAAWLDGEGGLLLQHINTDIAVRIYQKDVYKYSLEPEDYRDITKDALNRVNTLDFEWTKVDRRSTDEVYLEAKHTFKDPDGDRHIVRLTYTLEKASGYWWITETGTAKWYNDL